MSHFELRTPVEATAQQLFDWHARPLAFERLNPPFESTELLGRSTVGLEVGSRVILKVKWGMFSSTWIAEHTALEPGRMFRDELREGPFKRWVHTHRFNDGEVIDEVEWKTRMGALNGTVEQRLERIFRYRHALIKADFARHERFRDKPKLRVAVTGSHGLIGSALMAYLDTAGHQVVPVARGELSSIDGCDAVVNLAGAPLARRWSYEVKRELVESRVDYTCELVAAMRAAKKPPRVLISGSAVGAYGDRGDEVLTEDSTVGPISAEGSGFLTRLCADWEAAAMTASDVARVVVLRTGIVMSPAGGALASMLTPFKTGMGGPLGTGEQWMSWISIEDQLGAIEHVLMREQLSGPVNLVAPSAMTASTFAQTLGRVLHRPAAVKVPKAALKAMFGEAADAAMLASQRVEPSRLLASGFQFLQPDLETSLRFLLGIKS